MKIIIIGYLAGLTFLFGCAQTPENISASYVSPMQYQSYTCEQIEQELNRVGVKLQEVTQIQFKKSSGDANAMALGLFIFWPALLFLGGDTGREPELARLKGEIEAIEMAAIEKNCQSVIQRLARNEAQAKEEKAQKEREEKEFIHPLSLNRT